MKISLLQKKNNVTLVSTDFTVEELIANGMEQPAAERTHARYVTRLKRASSAGVNIVFGTDIMADVNGRTRGQVALGYVNSFTEAGIAPADILRAMTIRAAALLDVDKQRGALRVGMAADLVATPIDPLKDVLHGLEKIDFVMKNGEIYRR
jgi:imidazolonepropionase-like amidohydrolase